MNEQKYGIGFLTLEPGMYLPCSLAQVCPNEKDWSEEIEYPSSNRMNGFKVHWRPQVSRPGQVLCLARWREGQCTVEHRYEQAFTVRRMQLKLLTANEIHEYARKNRFMEANLSYVAWQSCLDLSKSKLSRTRFTGAHMRRVDFTESELMYASAENVRWEGAVLSYASLDNSWLVRADMPGVVANHTSFFYAKLNCANLDGLHAEYADFREAELQMVNLQGAYLVGADLSLADLRGANLRGANLRGAKLAGAKLAGANFQDANLEDVDTATADWSGVVFW